MALVFPDSVIQGEGGRIILVVLDGLGGLPREAGGATELETARTPHLDALARRSALGLHHPVRPGITPGSGPGHLALFGYDPERYTIGRGVLSALGVGFDLVEGDVAIRLNFATLDSDGLVTDRRAGRPNDAENRRLVEKLRGAISEMDGVGVFFEPEKEHRAVLILRGRDLVADLGDTDPQETGVAALPVRARTPEAESTAALVQSVLDAAHEVLADEDVANGLLARGIDAYSKFPGFGDRYGLTALAIARYPMYRGVAKLVGMDTRPIPVSDEASVALLGRELDRYDYHFIHFKAMDSRGEDGDFDAKVAAIEAVDPLIGKLAALKPDVIVVTGDHSTPSLMRVHSWHPVPFLIAAEQVRGSQESVFGESACLRGELGIIQGKDLMTLALAHAGRLAKFGA
jgi:2,3-bisphosphoglycerate-independent phosphoglycerate mutase